MRTLSPRLAGVVSALPLRSGMRVIEIGCGPGAAARAVAERVGPDGHVLARLARMLVPGAALYIDGGDPLRRIELPVRD